MIFNHYVLHFLITSVMVLSCHDVLADTFYNSTRSELTVQQGEYAVQDEQIQEQIQNSLTAAENDEVATHARICDSGTYVAACGDYRVGFNWLKSARLLDPVTSSADYIRYKTTKDYYNENDDIITFFDKMRIFFGNKTGVGILDANGNLVAEQDVKADREAILNNLCLPTTNSKLTCLPCPPNDADNKAEVPESYVELNNNNLAISGSWHFYTIADCYMKNFTDSTGTYFYVPEVIDMENATPENAEECYYANTNSDAMDALNGDAIGEIAPRVSPERILSGQASTMIPKSGYQNK